MVWRWFIIAGILISCFSCTSVISSGMRSQVTPNVSFADVAQNPAVHIGQVIIAGGTIIETKNLQEGTLLEILQYPTTSRGRPKLGKPSEGRFLVLVPGYLETTIYRPGRQITVAGEVSGLRELPLGETTYRYPVFTPRELHLWSEGNSGPRLHIGFGFGFSKGF
jgi:outer membrane lipoprotein